MSADSDLAELHSKYPQLSEKELTALRFASSNKMIAVAQSTSESFYQLFIAGRSCQEIQQLNPGFSLAQIVGARISGKWDERLKEQIEKLAQDAMALIGQTKLESIRHQADLIRVHHKLYGSKIAKFLQTGDEAELNGVPLPAYKTLIQLFNESTAVSKDSAPIQVEVKVTDAAKIIEGAVIQTEASSGVLSRMAKKLKDE